MARRAAGVVASSVFARSGITTPFVRSTMFAARLTAALGAVGIAAAIAGVFAQEADLRGAKASVTQHQPLPVVDKARSTDWADHNGDAANSRFAPLDQITPANAGTLAVKWTFDAPAGSAFSEQTPLVVDGVMYFNSGSRLFALDA